MTTRSRSAAAVDVEAMADVDALVEAVVARLGESALLAPAAAAATVPVDIKAENGEGELGPTPAQQRLWIAELRRQMGASAHYGIREKEEARGLLIIGEGAGPPSEHQTWYWGRVRLFLIIAHQGWAAAVRDSRTADMERLGIRLTPAAAQPPAAPRPAAAPPTWWRGRPSRPSGLRPPPGSAASAAAARRKN